MRKQSILCAGPESDLEFPPVHSFSVRDKWFFVLHDRRIQPHGDLHGSRMDLSKRWRNRTGVQSVRRCLKTTPVPGSPGAIPKGSCSSKEARRIVASAVSHQVPSRLGQLAGQCLGGDNLARLGCLAVKPSAGIFVIAPSKIGCLDECPCQIFVAALGIVFAFTLAVAFPFSRYGSAVTGVVFRACETADVCGFQADDPDNTRPMPGRVLRLW